MALGRGVSQSALVQVMSSSLTCFHQWTSCLGRKGLPASTAVYAGKLWASALPRFHARILLVDDINASAAPDYLGAWRVFQGAQGIANLHFIHLLGDQSYLLKLTWQ